MPRRRIDGCRWNVSGLFGAIAGGKETYIELVVVAGEAIEEEMSVDLIFEMSFSLLLALDPELSPYTLTYLRLHKYQINE